MFDKIVFDKMKNVLLNLKHKLIGIPMVLAAENKLTEGVPNELDPDVNLLRFKCFSNFIKF